MGDRRVRPHGSRPEVALASGTGPGVANRPGRSNPKPAGSRSKSGAKPPGRTLPRRPSPDVAPAGIPTDSPSRAGWVVAAGVLTLSVLYLPNLSYSAIAPQSAILLIIGAAGFPLLVARAMALVPGRAPEETWAARCAVGFVAVGALSAAVSEGPWLSVVGPFQQPTGLLFMAALGGCWALGTGLGAPERRLVETAIIAGALVNAVIAILQVLVGLGALDLASFGSQPTGTLGNPVFLGALLAGSVALLAPRFLVGPKGHSVATVLVGLALGMCGERLPALMALVVVAWTIWQGSRRPDPSGAMTGVKRPLVFGGVLIGSIVVGSIVTALRSTGGVISQAAASTTSETFGQRLSVWQVALRAIWAHPVLGSGPGQFLGATSRYYSESFTRTVSGTYFLTAHNLIVEYAATIGLVGTGLGVAWVALAVLHRRGPLVAFALVLLATELAEPLNPVITPLAFLALGASGLSRPTAGDTDPANLLSVRSKDPSSRGGRAGRNVRRAMVITALVAAVPAALYLVGGASYVSATEAPNSSDPASALGPASTAESLLSPWPNPATELSSINLALYVQGQSGRFSDAVRWARVAVARDPTDPGLWTLLADLQLAGGRPNDAVESASQALRFGAWDPEANAALGIIAASRNQRTEAERYLERALAVAPQHYVASVLHDVRRGCRAQALTPRQPSLQFTCR